MKKLSVLLVLVLLIFMVAGCGGKSSSTNESTFTTQPSTEEGSSSGTASETGSNTVTVPNFEEIEFPDSLPTKIIFGNSEDYAYDDLSAHYTVSILTTNNGVASPSRENDPICQWLEKKFNLTINFETCSSSDLPTIISTRFASGDAPDFFTAPDQNVATTLYEAGQLVDGRKIYPYMPLTAKYTTKYMIKALTSTVDGGLPCVTHYAFQDAVWGFAIRKDWLDKFGMKEPTTEDELLAFAKACTEDDPDGNGVDDTYFMIGACSGNSVTSGMMKGWPSMFGNPETHVENGQLVDPMLDGTRKKCLEFLNKLYTSGYLHPDWYTISWEKAKSYTHNDKIGMVYYPPADLLGEYTTAKNQSEDSLDVWKFLEKPPIENGKFVASGSLGKLFCFSSKGFEDEGKLKRVAHMIDTMTVGGENFFHTVQGGSDEIYSEFGKPVESHRTWTYNDDGTFMFYTDASGWPWNDNNYIVSLTGWQNIGWGASYERKPTNTGNEFADALNVRRNAFSDIIAKYDRWPNDGLISSVSVESIAPGLTDFVNARELEFVLGKTSFSEWDNYVNEWLTRGGKDVIAAKAAKLGVDVPDYAK